MIATSRHMNRLELEALAEFDASLGDHAASAVSTKPIDAHTARGWTSLHISLLTIGVVVAIWWLVAAFEARLTCIPAIACRCSSTNSSPSPRTGSSMPRLLQHLTISLGRVFAALLAALAVGVPVGLAIGLSTVGKGIFDPLLEFLRPLPPLAYLPLIIIWFGIGEAVESAGDRDRHAGADRAVDRGRRAQRQSRPHQRRSHARRDARAGARSRDPAERNCPRS